MLFPLFVVTNWQANAAIDKFSNFIAPAAIDIDSKLTQWWNEVTLLWGVQRTTFLREGSYGRSGSTIQDTSGLMDDRQAAGGPISRQRHPPGFIRLPPYNASMSELARSTPYSTHRLSDLLNESSARDTPHDRRHQLIPPSFSSQPASPLTMQSLLREGEPLSNIASSSGQSGNNFRTPEDGYRSAVSYSGGADDLLLSKHKSFSFDRPTSEQHQSPRRTSLRLEGGRSTWAPELSLSRLDRYRTSTTTQPYPPRMRSASIADLVSSQSDRWRDTVSIRTTTDIAVDNQGKQSGGADGIEGGEGFAVLLDAVEERTRKS